MYPREGFTIQRELEGAVIEREDLGDRRLILSGLEALLSAFGSANDAEDHGYTDEAVRLREGSQAAIRALLAEHTFVARLFPHLLGELDTQRFLYFGWADACRAVGVHLESPGARAAGDEGGAT